MGRWIIAFIISWALLTVLGIATTTQFVLANLSGLGVDISFATRLRTTLEDIRGMGLLYGIIFGGGFLGAMITAGLLAKFITLPRGLIFSLAGAIAIAVTLWALSFTFEITPLAATRTGMGVVAQCLVGALVGLIFARAAFADEN